MISWLQRKCDQYWPERGTKRHGQIQVTLKETLNMSHYTLRKFIITHKQVGKNYVGTSFPFVLGVAFHLSFLRSPWDFCRSDFKTPQTLVWLSGFYFYCCRCPCPCTNIQVTLYLSRRFVIGERSKSRYVKSKTPNLDKNRSYSS